MRIVCSLRFIPFFANSAFSLIASVNERSLPDSSQSCLAISWIFRELFFDLSWLIMPYSDLCNFSICHFKHVRSFWVVALKGNVFSTLAVCALFLNKKSPYMAILINISPHRIVFLFVSKSRIICCCILFLVFFKVYGEFDCRISSTWRA